MVRFRSLRIGNKALRAMPEMELTSPAFDDGEPIPEKHSCDGEGVSPSLAWSFLPKQAGSLALIVHDPDAPSGDFLHWLAWNLDPEEGHLDEGAPAPFEGANGRGDLGYMGPCPPPGHGAHRYIFHLYALDSDLGLEAGATREQLKDAMDGKVLGDARLVGVYERT
jgi:Raf kinase inhibitor-like YbhB/YbcL family protein